jgi:hypothetical protein
VSIGRRPVVIGAVCFALGLLGYQFLPRDETHITSLLTELGTRLNQTRDPASLARLQEFLRRALTPAASIRIDELAQDVQGREAIADHARVLLDGLPLSFALSSVEVHLSGRLARVDADLTVSVSGSAEQRRELRRTRVRLSKAADAWQIEAIEVEPIAPAQMEARP